MKNWLKNETVVLTGASSGIGRELAKILINKYEANVIGIGRSESKMLSLKKELVDKAAAFSYRLFDVSDKSAWENFANSLNDEGRSVRLLINNAGYFPAFLRVEDMATEDFEKVISINYLGTVYAVNAIFPLLSKAKKESGAIVNICSSSALCTVVGTAAYSASKAALKGYTEALQMEERGKRYVGIFFPGTTATDLFRNDENTKNSALHLVAMPAEKMAKKIAKRIVKKRKRSIVGWDAKLMNLTAKLMPVLGLRIICWVMKSSRSKVFSQVFKRK